VFGIDLAIMFGMFWGRKLDQKGSLSSDTTLCIQSSLMHKIAKGSQECIRVGWGEIEPKVTRTRIENKWASKGDSNTHLGSHTLG